MLLAGLVLVASAVHADEIVIHTVSWHATPKEDYTVHHVYEDGSPAYDTQVKTPYNNVNPGIGYRWDNGWNVGYYHNSYSKPSFYFAREWAYNRYFGAMLGLATGYKDENKTGLLPIGALTARLPITERVTLGIQALPPIGKIGGVAHLTISYTLQR